jgi:niacin transporter
MKGKKAGLKSIRVALGGLFIALSLAIPLSFRGILQFTIPAVGYSATLASHVPVMLSMVLGPTFAGLVGFGSTLGFFVTLGPVVGARAATHILWGVAGAFALERGMPFSKVLFIIALPIHAIAEGLVVVPFGIPWEGALINTMGGALHHIADSIISLAILKVVHPYLKNLVAKNEA